MTRRWFLASSAGLLLSGCTDRNPALTNAAQVARNMVFGYPDLELQRSEIDKLPYATMTARVGKGPHSLLVLARIQGEDQHWVSADRAVLVLRGGRVVQTYGFPENLKATRALGEDPVAGTLHRLKGERAFTRLVDLDRGRYYGLSIDSHFRLLGPERIEIVDVELETILAEERNEARHLNWSFRNLYWVDPGDGFVWRSEQHIARSFPPLKFEIAKPPG